ncbi:hypothetical protein BaRGS_00009796 [Batillaria attramentaria]|uniref:Uncharacterized protein n=1 Tax=Batillaria attramentaria TaxID=370345 RepID=A0ABD0LJ26_9CAEN
MPPMQDHLNEPEVRSSSSSWCRLHRSGTLTCVVRHRPFGPMSRRWGLFGYSGFSSSASALSSRYYYNIQNLVIDADLTEEEL